MDVRVRIPPWAPDRKSGRVVVRKLPKNLCLNNPQKKMKREAFALLKKAEKSWWYSGRARAVRAMLDKIHIKTTNEPVLDFGAGFGGMFAELRRLSPDVYAFEPNAAARAEAAKRGYKATYATKKEALSRRYAQIGLFDVIEHIENDIAFLRSLHQALTPDGLLIFTVPVFPLIWNDHDVMNEHFRRYTRRSFTKTLQTTGYEILAISHWNMLLFFPAMLVRLMGYSGSSSFTGGFLNWILTCIVMVESFLIRIFPLPFGVSLVVIARRKNTSTSSK